MQIVENELNQTHGDIKAYFLESSKKWFLELGDRYFLVSPTSFRKTTKKVFVDKLVKSLKGEVTHITTDKILNSLEECYAFFFKTLWDVDSEKEQDYSNSGINLIVMSPSHTKAIVKGFPFNVDEYIEVDSLNDFTYNSSEGTVSFNEEGLEKKGRSHYGYDEIKDIMSLFAYAKSKRELNPIKTIWYPYDTEKPLGIELYGTDFYLLLAPRRLEEEEEEEPYNDDDDSDLDDDEWDDD